jgi:hypothetical protein
VQCREPSVVTTFKLQTLLFEPHGDLYSLIAAQAQAVMVSVPGSPKVLSCEQIQMSHMPAEELKPILESLLTYHFGKTQQILQLECQPSDYRTSFPIEVIKLSLHDVGKLEIILKKLGWDQLAEGARRVKPKFLHDPLREIEVYHSLLGRYSLGTAICYGSVVKPDQGRYWLFLEKVSGLELYQIGDLATWKEVACWLARMHLRFAAELCHPSRSFVTHLLRYDQSFYEQWMTRALTFARTKQSHNSVAGYSDLTWLARRYAKVIERLTSLPSTIIHGEFYASNILVDNAAGSLRVCPVDWEMAAVGPGLVDLAALIAGKWTDEEREEIAFSYYTEIVKKSEAVSSREDFFTALQYCRLHLAIQWLGWANKWTPPPEHSQNWLEEAARLGRRLFG